MHQQYEERKRLGLLTQAEVCELAGCSPGRLQYHSRHGCIDPPNARLYSRFYYSQEEADRIVQYFKGRKRWEKRKK